MKEVALLRKHFKIKGQGDKVRVSGEISPEDITNFFREYFAFIRPKNLSDSKILPTANSSKLRALYIGHPDINLLLNLIIRHCLYVDQIVVVDPFNTLPHDKIQEHPEVWAQIVINRALCLCALEDWISEEIVLIVPSPLHYYPQIRQLIGQNPESFEPKFSEKRDREYRKEFITRLLINEPKIRRSAILEMLEKDISEDEKKQLLEEAALYEAKYPIRFRLSSAFYEKHFKGKSKTSQAIAFSLSLPLLLAPMVANEIGSFLIFDRRILYETLAENYTAKSQRINSLQQLAIAFQELEFPFLHNVPLKKALKLRKKGYLEQFRQYLRIIWSTIAQGKEDEIFDEKISEFSDKLNAEYSSLQREWKYIKKDLQISAATSGMVIGVSAASAIALGNIDWSITVAAGAGLMKEHVSGYRRISEKLQQTYQNPLSVFLELE
jgi:hypothetical protein